MIPFKAPTDDILFSLEHIAGAGQLDNWDLETAREILEHFASLAEDVIAPLNAVGDEQGARFENGSVRLPDGFADAYGQLIEGGWQGLGAPEEFGGMALSPLIGAAVSEVFSGANLSLQMVCNLVPGVISTLMNFGSQAQKDRYIPRLCNGELLATMCLTEPSAGSDLSAVRTTATKAGLHWQIKGEKIFISGGDQDLSPSTLHLVLARSGASEDGLKGLSLFLCEKQPAARVTRLEEKMGLHASPTCQMVFENANGELLGEEGAGLKAMFTLMNHARLDVALQGVAFASRAFHIASTYANDRKQGRLIDGQSARLHEHADVRRMLDQQQILAIGTRAMCHLAFVELELGKRRTLPGFLTSLCKVLGSEAGMQAAHLGMQILGGYGYLKEYQLEQTFRDARITAIYEGANGIHTRNLVTRGLRPDGGANEFASLVEELSDNHDAARVDLERWNSYRRRIAAMNDPTTHARSFAEASGNLLNRAIWVRLLHAAPAHSEPAEIARLAALVLKDEGYGCRIA